MDLIGGEDDFGRKIKNVGGNSDVYILIRSIGIHQEFKISRTKTDSVWIDRVCKIKYHI